LELSLESVFILVWKNKSEFTDRKEGKEYFQDWER